MVIPPISFSIMTLFLGEATSDLPAFLHVNLVGTYDIINGTDPIDSIGRNIYELNRLPVREFNDGIRADSSAPVYLQL